MSTNPGMCQACGMPRELSRACIYSVNNSPRGVEAWERYTETLCGECRVRLGLYCLEHTRYMICAYDGDLLLGRLAKGLPTIYACCPQCLERVTRGMPPQRAATILAYVAKGNCGLFFTGVARSLAERDTFASMSEAERTIFGAFMYTGLLGYTFSEFVGSVKRRGTRAR